MSLNTVSGKVLTSRLASATTSKEEPYGAFSTLVKKKWIVPAGNDGGSGDDSSSRKEYVITELGKQASQKELERIEELGHLASKIMGGAAK